LLLGIEYIFNVQEVSLFTPMRFTEVVRFALEGDQIVSAYFAQV